MFVTKKKMLFHRAWAHVELDTFANIGDVLELPGELARTLVQNGIAEVTTRQVGRATTTTEGALCWRCTGRQPAVLARCPFCGAPQQ